MIWFITKMLEIWLILLYIEINILNKMNSQIVTQKVSDNNNLNTEGVSLFWRQRKWLDV
jgi:hypothetical protein